MFLKYKSKTKKNRGDNVPRMTSDPGAPRLKTTNFFQFPKCKVSEQVRVSRKHESSLDDVFYDDETQTERLGNVPSYILKQPAAPQAVLDQSDSSSSEEETDSDESCDLTSETSSDDTDDEEYDEDDEDDEDDECESGFSPEGDDSESDEEPDILKRHKYHTDDSQSKQLHAEQLSVINLISSDEEDQLPEPEEPTTSSKRKNSSVGAKQKKKKRATKKLSSSEESEEEFGLSEESMKHAMASTPPIAGNPPYNWPWK